MNCGKFTSGSDSESARWNQMDLNRVCRTENASSLELLQEYNLLSVLLEIGLDLFRD